jgi:Tfp pilus assembly protein PilO
MRKLLYPILFLILAGFGFFWYLQPTYADIQELQGRIGDYDETLSQVDQLQTELNEELEKRDGITNDQIDRLDQILPETVDTVRFLIELDQIAAQHGMSVDEVSFSGAPSRFGGSGGNEGGSAGYNSLEASFSVSGSYADVQNFMRDIERSSRLLDITNFSLAATTNDTNNGQEVSLSVGDNEYTFTLRTYWQSDNGNNSES